MNLGKFKVGAKVVVTPLKLHSDDNPVPFNGEYLGLCTHGDKYRIESQAAILTEYGKITNVELWQVEFLQENK